MAGLTGRTDASGQGHPGNLGPICGDWHGDASLACRRAASGNRVGHSPPRDRVSDLWTPVAMLGALSAGRFSAKPETLWTVEKRPDWSDSPGSIGRVG